MADYIKIIGSTIYVCLIILVTNSAFAQHDRPVLEMNGNRIDYFSDQEGNRVPDFSHAGYRSGEAELPYYPVKVSVAPRPGDDTQRINSAISYVENLPPDNSGVRGAILLQPGIFNISGTLKVEKSGVVLRGSGSGEDPQSASILRVSKTFRGTPVQIGTGKYNWYYNFIDPRTEIITDFVPVGSRSFEVADASFLDVGDNIIIRHNSSQQWLDAINGGGTATDPPWEEGYIEIYYNRVITAMKDSTISVDAPIFNHLDRSLSRTTVFEVERENLIEESGVEYLRIEIQTDGVMSENHAENGVIFDGVENGWARYVNVFHFRAAGFGTTNSKNITIVNSGAYEPHSSEQGERRYNFSAQAFSNNILFKDVNSSFGRRSFVSNGTSVASGIVFLNAHSRGALNSSEGHQRWSQGLLFDNVTFEDPQTYFVLGLYNRGDFGSSHGWGAVHSVAWNVDASDQQVIIQKPPTAQNYAIGVKGDVSGEGIYDHPAGYIDGINSNATPRSLYQAQLNERLRYGAQPDGPSTLTVSSEINNQLDLSWHHSATKETDFIIQRSSDGGQTFQTIATVEDSDSSFTDRTMGDRLYHYRVRAQDVNGRSAYSNLTSGQATFDNEYLSNVHLVEPLNNAEISIDSDPDNMLIFQWEIPETELDIEYTLLLDTEMGDFSEPLAEIHAGNENELMITYRTLINTLSQNEIAVEDEYVLKWTVRAEGQSIRNRANEEFALKLVKDSDSEILDDVDKQTELTQNYPNPFNPVTTIRFFLSEESDISIDIFDLAGFKVATVEQGFKEAGYHDVEFDGSTLASGVYLYRLKTKNQVQSRKMILIK